jgi:hypothetical protein
LATEKDLIINFVAKNMRREGIEPSLPPVKSYCLLLIKFAPRFGRYLQDTALVVPPKAKQTCSLNVIMFLKMFFKITVTTAETRATNDTSA